MVQILRIDPQEGPAAGRTLLTIIGAGLRPQEPGDPFGLPLPAPAALLIGGKPATGIRVFSDVLMTAIAPASQPGPVDVQLDVLDDQGGVLGTDTLAGGYRFARPDFVAKSPIKHLCEAIRRRFAEQILENTVLAEDVDFDGTPTDHRGRISNAGLPAIALVLRQLPLNTFESDYTRKRRPQADGTVRVDRPAYTIDIIFDVFVFVDSDAHRFSIPPAILANISRRPLLDVPSAVGDDASEPISYDLDILAGGDFRNAQRPNQSNLKMMAAALVVRQFRVESQLGFPNDLFAERALPILEVLTRLARQEP